MACLELPKREGAAVSWRPWIAWLFVAEGATVRMVPTRLAAINTGTRSSVGEAFNGAKLIYRERQGHSGPVLVVQHRTAGALMVCILANRDRVRGFRSCFTGRATGSAPGGLVNGASVRDFGREGRCRDLHLNAVKVQSIRCGSGEDVQATALCWSIPRCRAASAISGVWPVRREDEWYSNPSTTSRGYKAETPSRPRVGPLLPVSAVILLLQKESAILFFVYAWPRTCWALADCFEDMKRPAAGLHVIITLLSSSVFWMHSHGALRDKSEQEENKVVA